MKTKEEIEAFIQHIFKECEEEGFTYLDVKRLSIYLKDKTDEKILDFQKKTLFNPE